MANGTRESVTMYRTFTPDEIRARLEKLYADVELDDPKVRARVTKQVLRDYESCVNYATGQGTVALIYDDTYVEDELGRAAAGQSWEGVLECIEEAGAADKAQPIFDAFFVE